MDFDEWWEQWRDSRIDLFVNVSDASLKQQTQVMVVNKDEAEEAWTSARKDMVPVNKLNDLMEHWRNLPIVTQAVGAEELVEELCGQLEDLIIKEHSA